VPYKTTEMARRMHARSPRKTAPARESGFTLVELLVVILIIGMLAAIAIPVFLNQRRKAVDATIKSDLRTVAIGLETVKVDKSSYPTLASDLSGDVKVSPGTSVAVYRTPDTYCLVGTRAAGVQPTHAWVYDSTAGGLQDSTVTTCAGASTSTLP